MGHGMGVSGGGYAHGRTDAARAEREFIMLGGRPIATVSPDPLQVNRLQASSTVGMPGLDLLGNIVSTAPTGVVVVQQGVEGVAFALDEGRVIGAFGTGPRGSMQAWSQAARTQEIAEAVSGPRTAGVGLARLFIERCVLEHLPMATEVGSVVTVLRGDVRWTGTTLAADDAPGLQPLLMEFARESDDCKVIERRLQPLSRLAVPIAPPLQDAASLKSPSPSAEDDFGQLGDADEADDPHQVLWAVWRMCSVDASIDAIAEQSVFGRAPTLRALDELRRRGCVHFADGDQATLMAIPRLHLPPPAAPSPTPPQVEEAIAAPLHVGPARRTGLVVAMGIALGCAVIGGAFWLGMNSAQKPAATPAEVSAAPTRPDAAPPTVAKADLASLRLLTLRERRMLRARGDDEGAEEIHIALDLVQARQSPTPCRTFAEALDSIEASEGGEHYSWALEQAEAPPGNDSACAGLHERLGALRKRHLQ